MKPSVFLIVLFVAAASVAARAETYIGFDTSVDEFAWQSNPIAANYPQEVYGVALHMGERFSPNFGAEVGYSTSFGDLDDNHTNQVAEDLSYRLTIRELQFDGYAYLPLGPAGWAQPFLTLGGAYAEANARERIATPAASGSASNAMTNTYSPFFHQSEIDWRAGFGMAFRISSDFSTHFTARYQPYSFGSKMSGSTTVGIGFDAAL